MYRFKLEYHTLELELEHAFGISRGTKRTVQNVFVKLSAGGYSGYGEAAPNVRYNEDSEKVCRYLKKLSTNFLDGIQSPKEFRAQINQSSKSAKNAAKSSIEMAWLDWWSKQQDQPLWKLWNAPSQKTPGTSFTIGLDEIDIMQEKVREAVDFPVLKLKLGTDHDREIIKAIRAMTDKPIRVDANEGWKTLKDAKSMIDFLTDWNIEMVEQPMPVEKFSEMVALKKYSPLPLCADESFKGDESLSKIANAFDIINIKLSKIGSLLKARQVISQAKENGLAIMIGCMIESSLSISAGALLGTWADFVDLDGHLLIKNDPAEGLIMAKGKSIQLSEKPGFGIILK